jgi:hypothetical protein
MSLRDAKFDLLCNHPERGLAAVEEGMSFGRATAVMAEAGFKTDAAEDLLAEAVMRGIEVDIQRPGKHPETICPQDIPE